MYSICHFYSLSKHSEVRTMDHNSHDSFDHVFTELVFLWSKFTWKNHDNVIEAVYILCLGLQIIWVSVYVYGIDTQHYTSMLSKPQAPSGYMNAKSQLRNGTGTEVLTTYMYRNTSLIRHRSTFQAISPCLISVWLRWLDKNIGKISSFHCANPQTCESVRTRCMLPFKWDIFFIWVGWFTL